MDRVSNRSLLKANAQAGHLGQKSGAGFYLHKGPRKENEPKKMNQDCLIDQGTHKLAANNQMFYVYRLFSYVYEPLRGARAVVTPKCGVSHEVRWRMQGVISIAEEKVDCV